MAIELVKRSLLNFEAEASTLLFFIFLMSFVLFRIFYLNKSFTEEEFLRRRKKCEKYFTRYKEDNERFFIC
jgi:hypothetical protein